jgi:O-antigen ligase
MIKQNIIINKNRLVRTVSLFTISIAFYILFSYIGVPAFMSENFSRLAMYFLLYMTVLNMLIKNTTITMTMFSIWYFIFGILGLLSSVFALNATNVYNAVYEVLVSWIIVFAFIQFARNFDRVKVIFFCYAYSAAVLAILLFVTGKINTGYVRLGQTLFRNANNLAMLMMISLICISWLLVYGTRKLFFINIVIAIVLFYITALTGGRKYLLMPVLFLFLLLYLKGIRDEISKFLLYMLIFVCILFLSFYAVVNIPTLYNMIGIRFQGLFNFLSGNISQADSSTIIRYKMIQLGWENYFPRNPIIGNGLDNFRLLFNEGTYSNNNFIELLVDLGVIGFICYYAFYVYIIIKLIRIKNDSTGLRDFFLAFMIILLVFEWGAVTYSLTQIQIMLGLASAYIAWKVKKPYLSTPRS